MGREKFSIKHAPDRIALASISDVNTKIVCIYLI